MCFLNVGISDFDGTMDFYFPENDEYVSCSACNHWDYDEQKRRPIQVSVNKLSTLMAKNHHKQIDLLKMDKEGSEYVVINDLIEENVPVTQICIESHHCFKGIGLQKTMVAVESLRALIRMVSILLRSLIQKKNIRSFIDESPIS